MKKSTFSHEQVAGIVREGPSGMAVQALCAKHNISDPTDGKWKQK
jgi:putative transposase